MKLNLGSGKRKLDGYVNIDKYPHGNPDLVLDLECVPWPYADNSIDEIRACHALEHMGQETKVFLVIIQEIYRVLKPGGLLDVTIPPGHGESFLSDPTHVRPLYPQTFMLFSKRKCAELAEYANTPLAEYLDVDFEIERMEISLTKEWKQLVAADESLDVNFPIQSYNNVYEEIRLQIRKVTN